MVHPYLINTLNAMVLIVAGLIVYFLGTTQPPTALIAPAFGVLLLACTYHLRKHNRFVLNTVTALTLLIGVLTFMRINFTSFDWNLNNILLVIIGLSCLISSVLYVGTYTRESKESENNIKKNA